MGSIFDNIYMISRSNNKSGSNDLLKHIHYFHNMIQEDNLSERTYFHSSIDLQGNLAPYIFAL